MRKTRMSALGLILIGAVMQVGLAMRESPAEANGGYPVYLPVVMKSALSCDPLEPALTCGSGIHCVFLDETSTTCDGPTGAGTQGSACVDDSSCAASYVCINSGGPSDLCLMYCDLAAPACPGETVCLSLSPPRFYDGNEVGVCF